MTMTVLAGDIGGTKTILQLVQGSSLSTLDPLTPLYEATYPSQAYPDLVPIVQEFLHCALKETGFSSPIHRACFGIAGPVTANTSELTNLSWSLTGDRLAAELSIPQVTLINDFVAVGYGILGLQREDMAILQDVPPDPQGAIAVLGAGTGLGQCYVIPQSSGSYRVFASEGAHGDFAPRSPLEVQLLNYLKDRHQLQRISIERVVSGTGIANIYEFLRDQNPQQESPALAPVFQTWQKEWGKEPKTVDLSAVVSQAALSTSDFLAQQTLKLFVEAYGAEAGNLALKFLPYGGLYVAGGIAPKILPLLRQGNFMKAFHDKGRMGDLMTQFPVRVVLNPKVGLIGAALGAAQLSPV